MHLSFYLKATHKGNWVNGEFSQKFRRVMVPIAPNLPQKIEEEGTLSNSLVKKNRKKRKQWTNIAHEYGWENLAKY